MVLFFLFPINNLYLILIEKEDLSNNERIARSTEVKQINSLRIAANPFSNPFSSNDTSETISEGSNNKQNKRTLQNRYVQYK